MSSGWFAKKYYEFCDAEYDAKHEIDNGNTVAFGDDIEYFADQMKISVDSITEVER
jgi:hypothetical protein